MYVASRRLAAVLSALLVFGSAAQAQAIMCEDEMVDRVELLGSAPENQAFAIRIVRTDSTTEGHGAYPDVDGRSNYGTELRLCLAGADCTRFEVYQALESPDSARKTAEKDAAATLARAKHAFAERNVDLGKRGKSLTVGSTALAVGTLGAFKINGTANLVLADQKGLTIEVDGFSSLVLVPAIPTCTDAGSFGVDPAVMLSADENLIVYARWEDWLCSRNPKIDTISMRTVAANLYRARGIQRFDLQDYAGAEADFRIAVSIAPELAAAGFDLGLARTMLGQKQEAFAATSGAIKEKKSDSGYVTVESIVHRVSGPTISATCNASCTCSDAVDDLRVMGLSQSQDAVVIRSVLRGQTGCSMKDSPYPKVSGRSNFGTELLLCRPGVRCQEFEIYEPPCDCEFPNHDEAAASARLTAAKSTFAGAGVTLQREGVLVRKVPGPMTIPGLFAAFGIPGDGTVSLRDSQLVVGATGFTTTAVTDSMTGPELWVAKDGSTVVVISWEQYCKDRLGVVALRAADLAANLFNQRGKERFQNQAYLEAATDFRMALKLNPRFVDAAYNLAISELLAKRYEQALAALQAATRTDRSKATPTRASASVYDGR